MRLAIADPDPSWRMKPNAATGPEPEVQTPDTQQIGE